MIVWASVDRRQSSGPRKLRGFFRRRAAGWLWVVVMLAGGCKPSTESTGEAAPKTLPAVTEHTADIGGRGLNVLLISVDTTRADALACYGNPTVKTPNIDRLAAEGTRFAWGISSAPLTLPSHSTLLTGSYPFVHGARDNGIFRLDEANVTLAEIFKDAGYATHGEVAAAVLNAVYGIGQGFDEFHDVEGLRNRAEQVESAVPASQGLEATSRPVIEPEGPSFEVERGAKEITDAAVAWLQKAAKADQPFFGFLHYFDPHWPCHAPERFTSQYKEYYYAEIAYFDEQFGRLMDELRELGLDQNTLVVLTSDHGEGRGQHGEITHSFFLYDTTLHVPLIMWSPKYIPAGQVVETQVRTLDIAPTLVDFARLERSSQMQGVSLLPLVKHPDMKTDLPCYSDTMSTKTIHHYSPLRSLRTNEWKYILAPKPELYHVGEDRLELFNMVDAEPDRAAKMREELREIIANAPSVVDGQSTPKTIDEAELRKLEALGYATSPTTIPKGGPLGPGTELDRFEPEGPNPRDHVEEIECVSAGKGAYHEGDLPNAEKRFRRLVQLQPNHPLGYSYLGATLMAEKRYDEAIPMFRRSLEMFPDNYKDYRALGSMLAMRGELDEAETYLKKALEHSPSDSGSHFRLGQVYVLRERYADGLKEYEAALVGAPNRAPIYYNMGLVLEGMGRTDEAIRRYREAIQLAPKNALAAHHLANALALMGRGDEARRAYEHLMDTLPKYGPAYRSAADLLDMGGDLAGAVKVLRRGHQALPEDPDIANDLAWYLATAPDARLRNGAEAVTLAVHANEQGKHRSVHFLDTLAAAYAEAGRFEDAVATVNQALELAHEAHAEARVRKLEARRKLYAAHQPYRVPR